jgi:hypothetical protein
MLFGAHQQSGSDLLEDAKGEVGRRRVIHGDDDHSTQGAAKKDSDPLGAVFSPENNAVTFAYLSRL